MRHERSRLSRFRWLVALAVAVHLLAAPPAHAYMDPGSGSLIFQMLIGGFVAAGVAVRMFWGRIRSLFSRGDSSTRE